jgi:hypothetical protein
MFRAAWLMLLLTVFPAMGQLGDCWGVRVGGTTVVQDNYSAYTDESANGYGWLVGVSRTLSLTDWKSVRIVLEGQVRHSSWRRFAFGPMAQQSIDPKVSIHEFVVAPLFIHSVPVDRARFFLQAGPEISYVDLSKATYQYDHENWNKIVFSYNFGGGIIFPARHGREFVLDIRYNSDISKAVDDSGRDAPVGSRFDELHILLGVNFGLDEGY